MLIVINPINAKTRCAIPNLFNDFFDMPIPCFLRQFKFRRNLQREAEAILSAAQSAKPEICLPARREECYRRR
jgi:hypothetical protein